MSELAISAVKPTMEEDNKSTQKSKRGERRRLLKRFYGLLGFLIIVGGGIGYWAIDTRETALRTDLRQRLTLLSGSKAEIVTTWLDGIAYLGQQVAGTDLMQLYVLDASTTEGGEPSESVIEQKPYMEQWIQEFQSRNGLEMVAVLDPNGQVLLSYPEGFTASPDLNAKAKQVLSDKTAQFGQLRDVGDEILLDVILPIFPPQSDSSAEAIGTLIYNLPVRKKLTNLLTKDALFLDGEHLLLVQKTADELKRVDPKGQPAISRAKVQELPQPPAGKYLEARGSFVSDGEAFATARALPATDWSIVIEVDVDSALAELYTFRKIVIGASGMTVALLAAIFGAMWWQQSTSYNKAMATQYRDMAEKINRQHRILESINASVDNHIGLLDENGKYVYVNTAFARAFGGDPTVLIDKTDLDIFGLEVAMALGELERLVRDDAKPKSTNQTVKIDQQTIHMNMTRCPMVDENGAIVGMVQVSQDITKIIEQQLKLEATMKATISALAHAIELRSPYLSGHSANVGLMAQAVAAHMDLPEDARKTLDLTAHLSQIGKIMIPDEILNKPGRLTPEELKIMQSHVKNAVSVLSPIDFQLPVTETLSQMYERLDGSGYPNQLKNEQIGILSRILGTMDVFCALAERRAYRAGMPSDEAIAILRGQLDKFDAYVIDALEAMLKTEHGKNCLRKVSSNQLDDYASSMLDDWT